MPPGPAYNFLCVLSSAADIIAHAARIRASQTANVTRFTGNSIASTKRKRRKTDLDAAADIEKPLGNGAGLSSTSIEPLKEKINQKNVELRSTEFTDFTPTAPAILSERFPVKETPGLPELQVHRYVPEAGTRLSEPGSLERSTKHVFSPSDPFPLESIELDTQEAYSSSEPSSTIPEVNAVPITISTRHLQSSKVPSSRIGRLFHYGGLAASLGYGAASEALRRSTGSSESGGGGVMMTEANIKRLVSKLSQMRGAALKLGQFMSIQDTNLLPPEVDKIFRRVQDSAHYMPDWQLEGVLTAALGPTYSSHFTSFTRIPFAAASIGQVHHAILVASSSPTGKEENVAVKVQFPNIKGSIESDLGYVKMLLSAGGLLPKGLFLDRSITVLKGELADECDYTREASYLTQFGSSAFLGNDPRFKVPWVWEGSTDTVLVMEHVGGVSVGDAGVGGLPQIDRDEIASRIIELCLRELFEFRVMQTDPNWTNFLWNAKTRQIELVDFGATREYSKEFMDSWLRLLQSGAAGDRDACAEWSLKLGYLTGEENDTMLNAHINSMILLAAPFRSSTPQPVAFGPGTAWADATAEIRALIPVMLKYRLTPPPRETYSLNRKLSGAFLLASRLGARVDTKKLWDGVVEKYKFGH